MRSATTLWSTTLAALPLAIAAAGCGGGGGDNTGTDPGGPGGPGGAAGPTGGPTYYEDVAPILMDHCASCHRAGGIAPFALLTYDEAKTAAGAIRSVTEQRLMPPFNLDNSGACNTYTDARWLDGAQIATIGAWIDAGMQPGDPAKGPPVPPPPAGLDRVDATFDMGVSYTPNESLTDDYRCFVVDPGIPGDQFMIGAEVKPGDPRVVHHVILYALDSDNAVQQAENADAAEAGPGYTCFGGTGVSGSRWLVGWAPGSGPLYLPEGTGLQIPGGRKAVMQVHYNLVNGPLPDQTTIDVKLAPSVTYQAVVQGIPAPNLNLPPGQPLVEATNTTTVPANPPQIRVWGIAPHMHKLGKTMNVTATRGGQDICLGQVNNWNFHWQGFAHYTEPVTLMSGDVVRITCGYDTTTRTETTTWGEGTEDEMCIAFFYFTL